jgi:hypothetical protein
MYTDLKYKGEEGMHRDKTVRRTNKRGKKGM